MYGLRRARVAAPENNDQAWWQRIIRNASTADNDQGSTFKLDRRWTARAEVGDVKEHLGVPWLSVLVPLGLAQIIDLKIGMGRARVGVGVFCCR